MKEYILYIVVIVLNMFLNRTFICYINSMFDYFLGHRFQAPLSWNDPFM